MSRRTLELALLLATMLALPPPATAGAGDAIAHLTVYDAGIAEVLEERRIELQTGLNPIEWRSLMPRAFLRTVRVVVEGADILRQDFTYDGMEVRNERSPVLHVLVRRTGAAGPQRVQVDYLAPDMSWQNDYALVLESAAKGAPPESATLDSWVSISNGTGTDVSAGTVDLVAGEISLLVGSGDVRQSGLTRNYQSVRERDATPSEGPITTEESGLSAFSRFRLGSDITMMANAPVNRFPLFQQVRIGVAQRNVFENDSGAQTLARGGFVLLPRGLEVRLVSKNTTGVSMPAGDVTIYSQDGGLAQIVGQDRIGMTPPDGAFSVSQGRSSTIFGTRRVLDRRQERTERDDGPRLLTKVEVVLTNRGTVSAEAHVREGIENFGRNQWTILQSSDPTERLAANTVQFKLNVPAKGSRTVTYTVEAR